MATIVDRDHYVTLLREEWAAIDALCAALDDEDYATPTCLPGWTLQDQLSHILSTEAMLSGEPTPDIDVSHIVGLRNPIAVSNEQWVESLRSVSGPEVLDLFRRITAGRLDTLGAMTQADFDAPSWTPAGPDETFGRFMRIRHFDCFTHEHDIRVAVGAPDRDEPAHVQSAVDEVATGLGYIVGRKAGLPVGTSIRLAVDGPIEQTWLIDIPERARVVDHLDGEPTVTLRLPAMLFLRLTAGRVRAEPYLGSDILMGGDEDLARQLATNLAFTI
jgi:uncharacterized protein (TIGR03083 family)